MSGRTAAPGSSNRPPADLPGLAPPAPTILAPFRRSPGRALMLGHVHPDADVLGTLMALGLALEARGWQVVFGGPHPAPGALDFLPGIERYEVLTAIEGSFDVAVLTDCPNPGRTEGLIDGALAAASVVVNIDHHPDNRRYGHVNWIDTSAAATGEMVYRLLVGLGLPVTPPVATNLFTAIHTDTGSFRYSNVTPATFQIAAELVRAGADPAAVASAIYERRASDSLRWLGESLARVRVTDDGRVAWLALPTGAVPEAFVESEELVNYPRSITSVRVACLLRELNGQVKVSLRAKGDVDVQRIAARFGGGGHPNAAGFSVPGALDPVTRDVLAAVREAVRS